MCSIAEHALWLHTGAAASAELRNADAAACLQRSSQKVWYARGWPGQRRRTRNLRLGMGRHCDQGLEAEEAGFHFLPGTRHRHEHATWHTQKVRACSSVRR